MKVSYFLALISIASYFSTVPANSFRVLTRACFVFVFVFFQIYIASRYSLTAS